MRFISLTSLLLGLMVLGGCHGPINSVSLQRFEFSQRHMGVQVRLVFYAADSTRAVEISSEAFDRMEEIENALSNYRPFSEAEQLVVMAYEKPVAVSKDLLEIVALSLKLARQSAGAFDITLGPLVQMWRDVRRAGHLPTEDEADAIRQRTGWNNVLLDSTAGTIELKRPDMELDFGGVGKGYAADEAMKIFRENGITRVLIEIGGEILLGHPPPFSDGWVIEIPNDPHKPRQSLHDIAIASSGDTSQFVEIDGRRYSHILDPRTGFGVTHRTQVTVLTRSAALADALSTLLSVLGESEGRYFLEQYYPSVEVHFLTL